MNYSKKKKPCPNKEIFKIAKIIRVENILACSCSSRTRSKKDYKWGCEGSLVKCYHGSLRTWIQSQYQADVMWLVDLVLGNRASQPSQSVRLRSQWKILSQQTVWVSQQTVWVSPQEGHPRLTCSLHLCVHTYTHENTWAHTCMYT